MPLSNNNQVQQLVSSNSRILQAAPNSSSSSNPQVAMEETMEITTKSPTMIRACFEELLSHHHL
jgi:hypothetical protein